MYHFQTHLKQFSLLLAGLFLLCGIALAQDRTWQSFTPKVGGWSILAPGILRPDEEALKFNSNQGSYTYNDANGFFAVVYKDYSAINFLFGKRGHYGKQRDLVVKANKGKLIKDVEFNNGKLIGREVHIRMPDNRVIERESNMKPMYRVQRFRMFFNGNRFYMVLAVLPEAEIDSADVTAYLNSFVLK